MSAWAHVYKCIREGGERDRPFGLCPCLPGPQSCALPQPRCTRDPLRWCLRCRHHCRGCVVGGARHDMDVHYWWLTMFQVGTQQKVTTSLPLHSQLECETLSGTRVRRGGGYYLDTPPHRAMSICCQDHPHSAVVSCIEWGCRPNTRHYTTTDGGCS